ncbi:hypothetical protein B0T10DRAFT_34159 [Thelonectria olida]|uniref:Uncharacterized protein n=1 Tax=Thelonectria olida TaxID=1576542 RepID=A0A9P8WMW8_9HYPO|nr:hypothetical protein B0T10DRAFT_34159 [Thelonectria olida]
MLAEVRVVFLPPISLSSTADPSSRLQLTTSHQTRRRKRTAKTLANGRAPCQFVVHCHHEKTRDHNHTMLTMTLTPQHRFQVFGVSWSPPQDANGVISGVLRTNNSPQDAQDAQRFRMDSSPGSYVQRIFPRRRAEAADRTAPPASVPLSSRRVSAVSHLRRRVSPPARSH